MEFYIHVFIFFIILFLYFHLIEQYKRGEDLEIYEMDYYDNANLQEVCEIKQPVLFQYNNHNPEFFDKITMETLMNSGSYDVKVKDIEDYMNDNTTIDYLVLSFQSSQTLMITDTHSKYFTENNETFIEDSGLFSVFHENDSFLKPQFSVLTKYDVCIGSSGACTPLRYHTNSRQFICVTSGKIQIKLTPWKSNKYLYPIEDYDNYEFFSPINVWKPQRKYFHEMDKIKFLEFDVLSGYTLYIPPYWWYSIKYSDQPDNIVCGFNYSTAMNCVSNLPKWGKYYLQQSNTKHKTVKKMDISPTNEKVDDNDVTTEDVTD